MVDKSEAVICFMEPGRNLVVINCTWGGTDYGLGWAGVHSGDIASEIGYSFLFQSREYKSLYRRKNISAQLIE